MNGLIFGATGSIGSYLLEQLEKKNNIKIIGTTTQRNKENDKIIFVESNNLDNLNNIDNLDIIIWAHGYNYNDNIETFDEENFDKMIDGNITFIVKSLHYLLRNNKINDNAKMVVISSIWQEFTRDNKLSYSISKSALSGFLKNVSYDLSKKNILINNILPGVIGNEMSIKTLSKEQFEYIEKYTFFNRLVSLEDIYNTVKFFVIDNTGVTGQSLKVDLGFTNIRKYS